MVENQRSSDVLVERQEALKVLPACWQSGASQNVETSPSRAAAASSPENSCNSLLLFKSGQ